MEAPVYPLAVEPTPAEVSPGASPPHSGGSERCAADNVYSLAENPATCPHREDVLWLATRLRISEREVAKLRQQRKQLERRLRKAKRCRK